MARLATVAAFGFSDFNPPVILDLYRRLGCRSCQFYRNEANPPATADVLKITAAVPMPIDSIHGVFGDDYDPASLHENDRRRAVETYRAEGELAVELGGPMVVVHPSNLAPADHTPSPDERAARLDPLRRSMEELIAIGEKLGVVYLWENNPNNMWVGNDPLQLADMLRAFNSPHARMCFDTGHALMTGTVADRLAACADVIGYLHVHDNDAKVDDHRMPGDGVTDWESVRNALHDTALDVPAMLEVFYLEDDLRKLAESDLPRKLARWMDDADAPVAAGSN